MRSSAAVSAQPVTRAPRTTKHPLLLYLAPPAAALCYPLVLALFHLSVTHASSWWMALRAPLLLAAIVEPVPGIYAYWRLGAEESPSPTQVRAKVLALLSVGAPPLYTALGVVLTMAHNVVSDLAVWPVIWAAATALLLGWQARTSTTEPLAKPRLLPRLRYAHGISAAVIVCIFLAMHLINHLAGLWSEAAHRMLMGAFRHVYRAGVVEPVLVALLMFQVVSGPFLVWQYARRSVDLMRTLQIASGVYLLFFVPAHMNSVFIYARAVAGIPTDWNFATGAPTGILLDAWNIRLLPHYLLGVFFVLTHLVLGARVIALAHDSGRRTADRLALTGIALAATVSIAIMLGMVGVHLGPRAPLPAHTTATSRLNTSLQTQDDLALRSRQ